MRRLRGMKKKQDISFQEYSLDEEELIERDIRRKEAN